MRLEARVINELNEDKEYSQFTGWQLILIVKIEEFEVENQEPPEFDQSLIKLPRRISATDHSLISPLLLPPIRDPNKNQNASLILDKETALYVRY